MRQWEILQSGKCNVSATVWKMTQLCQSCITSKQEACHLQWSPVMTSTRSTYNVLLLATAHQNTTISEWSQECYIKEEFSMS